jgi:cytidyltransferase-like protein
MKRALLFGTFDGLHEGHKALFSSAQKHGELIIALAPDSVVERLKGRLPVKTFEERRAELLASGLVAEVVESDDIEGTYHVLEIARPDIIVFGYDQSRLMKDFHRFREETGLQMPTVTLESFEPERYKSSLLRFS